VTSLKDAFLFYLPSPAYAWLWFLSQLSL